MAEDTVDVVMKRLDRRVSSRTKRLRLVGGEDFTPLDVSDPRHRLAHRYGTEAAFVDQLIADEPSLGEPLVPGLRYTRAEAVFAARHEMATTLTDVMTRRTRAHLRDRAACLAAAPAIAELLAPELGWDADQTARQVADYQAVCTAELAAAHAVERQSTDSPTDPSPDPSQA
jgi:glycerol-3-phosphate dehydrogenase